MALTVGVAQPGTISSVGVAPTQTISSVGVAQPGTISGVGNADGSQWVDLSGAGGTAGATVDSGVAPYDPYAAAQAAQAAQKLQEQNNWLGALPGSINNITQSGMEAFGSSGRTLQGSAESLFNTIKQGQGAIDTSRENVELNRLNGVKDILSFVRNGLRQGGSRLANMNATESSAAGELGRAYGGIGSDRMRNIGNSSFLQNRELDTKQSALDLQRGQGRTDWARTRDEAVSSIGNQVRQQLAQLDAQGSSLGITGKVQIDQEKQRVIDQGQAQLAQIDSWLNQQLGTVAPEAADKIRTNAVGLQQGGTGNITPFDFGQFAGQQLVGPGMDQLPIFTRNRREA